MNQRLTTISYPRHKNFEIKIAKVNQAFKGVVQSHGVSIVNDKDPLLQLNGSSKHITNRLKQLEIEMKEFKLNVTLRLLSRNRKAPTHYTNQHISTVNRKSS